MKVLIVDDEELTRAGVVSLVNWKSLGIDEVLQADDGVHGLEMARRHRPEIILCDVRMPRMTGIAMLEQVEAFLPDAVSIFMSGYSDKEYLKAAIKLKTVHYIEKPLDPTEIREAVLEAITVYRQRQHSHQGKVLKSKETLSKLALLFTLPYANNGAQIHDLAREAGITLSETTRFCSAIVRLAQSPEGIQKSFDDVHQAVATTLAGEGITCLYAEKKAQNLVYFFVGETIDAVAVSESILPRLAAGYGAFGSLQLAAGDPCTGVSGVYGSYASAVVLLQSSFFFPAGTPLTSGFLASQKKKPASSPDFLSSFPRLLSSMDEAGLSAFLSDLFDFYAGNQFVLPNQVRDLYYKLLLALEDAKRAQRLLDLAKPENIMDAIENRFTFHELHQVLALRTTAFLDEARQAKTESPTVSAIREYVGRHYANDLLSVKDISAHVFLSVSYVCTLFKNETGQTLNQYLTEYRLEKAKQLLSDARYKISDISLKVGYSDGNYFGKTFKKYTGLSPSEYREKLTR